MSYFLDFFKIIISYSLARCMPKSKHIWLFSERGTDARDNGYWFFKFINEKHPDINSYYCITKSSTDYLKVKNIGNVLIYNSLMHGINYFRAEALISSHAYLCAPTWHGIGSLSRLRLFHVKGKRIFLQHGIIKDMIPGITAKKISFDLFISGAKPEYKYICRNYGFSKKIVKYTGLARYDNLSSQGIECHDRKLILLMPTWRTTIRNISENDFQKTDYFRTYNYFINDTELHEFLEKTDQKLIFYPHYEIQKFLKSFSSTNPRIIVASSKDYDVQDLLLRCNLLITDYSSVFFDIAYLKKPIIFFQFDYEKYRETQYQEGYFNYKKSFGPVIENEKGVIKYLKHITMQDVAKKYQDRENNFFEFRDTNNCKRIYDEVVKVVGG